MIDSDLQLMIERTVTNNRLYHDGETSKFLRHCSGVDMDVPEEERLENKLGMMELRNDSLYLIDRFKLLFKNPIPYNGVEQ